MDQFLCRFADRAAFLDACPAAWDVGGPNPEMPVDQGALIVIGTILDPGEEPDDPFVPRPGFHVLCLFAGDPPQAFQDARLEPQDGDPQVPTEDPPPPPPGAVPSEVTRAQARVGMAAYILPTGKSLLSAVRDILAEMLAATGNLPDSDPRRIQAVQANEWWLGASVYRRDHPVLELVRHHPSIAMESGEVDQLFRVCSQIAT